MNSGLISMMNCEFEPQIGKPSRILLIDDDPVSHEIVEAQLYQDEYELLFCDDGIDAVNQVATLDPDLILLDIMMPEISGFEVCQQLKSTPQLQHIPIIFFTALDSADQIAAGLDAGADEFLSKPISRTELRARIRAMLRNRHQYESLQRKFKIGNNFSRVLLHDMRNPLAGIMLYGQLLDKQFKSTSAHKPYLTSIQKETKQLHTLLDQMQLLHKLQQEQQGKRRQNVDLRPILRDTVAKYHHKAKNKGIELVTNLPTFPFPVVCIDRFLIESLIEISVSSAIQFAPVQTTIAIDLTIAFPTSTEVRLPNLAEPPVLRLAIADQGPTLPDSILADVCANVELWDLLAPDRPGIGVVMGLCKMIVEVHGGNLKVNDTTHTTGVTLVVELPIPEESWQ